MAHIPTKHGLRTKLHILEKFSSINSLSKYDCIMLDGMCQCEEFEDCLFMKEVLKAEARRELWLKTFVPK